MPHKRVGGGNIFKNSYKEKDSQPDMRGDVEIDGVKYQVAGWESETKNGDTYLSLSFSIHDEDSGTKPKPVSKEEDDDSLPF